MTFANTEQFSVDTNYLFSYCNDDITSGMGVNMTAKLSCAIFLDSEMLSVYSGNEIKGIWIGLYDKAEDIKLFVSETLNGPNIIEQSVGDKAAGWYYFSLEEPVQITEKGLFIGYEAYGYKHIGVSDKDDINGAWFYNESWKNYADDLDGSICIKVSINGDMMPDREMSMEELPDIYAQVDKQLTISGVVRNNTLTPVDSYTIEYSVDNGEIQEAKIDKDLLCNQLDTFYIQLDNTFDIGVYDVNVNISSVNGDLDKNISDNSLTAKFYNKEYLFKKKVVVEEGTGTWCSWCPIGIVSLEQMKKKYPETFIPIAIHVNDPMQIQTYQGFIETFFATGIPAAVLDRKINVYPAFNEVEKAYLQLCTPADAGIDLYAEFVDELSSKISVRTNTVFGFSEEDANYRIILVLLENGVTGYSQVNGYSGGEAGPMGGFENLPNPIPEDQIKFDYVARGVYKSYTGILKSIPENIVKGENYEFEYNITVPLNVKDRDSLMLVAMIYDVDNGVIVNSDLSNINEYSGLDNYVVNEVSIYIDDNKIKCSSYLDSIEVYDLNGNMVMNRNLTSGLYIVKLKIGGNVVMKKILVN